ncbi:MAG: hypothetical protein GX806_02910, partial [Lentisphaerae bacterium]|nr:hypothetical protein [Lentisphaerota bacterium]
MIFLLRTAKHRLLWGWITAMLLAAGPLAADQIRTLDISAGGWRGSAGAAAVRPAREEAGVCLTCPFRGQTQRVFWDRTLNLDLRPYALLEMEFSCAQPEALRSLGIYLKSGAGWYLWLPRPTTAGRQTITLALDDAATEGKPKGWQSISGLRLSCTKAASINTEVVLHALRLRTCETVIVRADATLPNPVEGRAARSASARLSRCLNEIGLAHTIISDAQVASGALQTARVAILPYNPHPPRRELRALETFLKRGGRLLVFYAAEPRLAKMMGMTLGDYQAAKQVGQWSSFAFNQQAPAHVPPVVFQDSGNIRPVRPAAKGARVIATWRNQAGRTQKEPAWVQSQQGLWMAHILLDGDDANKKQMLLALLGELHPPAWQTAAAAAWNKSGRIASFQNLPETLAGIRRARTGKISAALVQQALAQDEELRIHVAQRRYPQLVQKAAELKATLLQLYASAQQPRTPEFRGVWNHSGCGLYPGDWNRTCKLLAEAGLTAVFPNLAWAGAAHYPSKLVPATQTARTYGDQLQQS